MMKILRKKRYEDLEKKEAHLDIAKIQIKTMDETIDDLQNKLAKTVVEGNKKDDHIKLLENEILDIKSELEQVKKDLKITKTKLTKEKNKIKTKSYNSELIEDEIFNINTKKTKKENK